MNDRRLLRRYLVLVHHAEDVLEASLGQEAGPAPAEAIAVLEELVEALEPAMRRMATESPQDKDVREALAGWVH